MMTRGPDFVIIGAMKSATTTLHRQLSAQPGIFLCDPKEPNFFSNDEEYCKGLDHYAALFQNAPRDALAGEASTHYTKLPTYPQTVERLKAALPDARFIYVMRHPVDRLISQYIHQWSEREISCDLETALGRHPELVSYSQYALQLAPYFAAFGKDAVLPVFFETLVRHPQTELERVCRFIGYRGQPQWQDTASRENVSQQRIRRFPLYDLLIESAPAKFLRRALVPKTLRQAVARRFTMQQRPDLSAASRARIEVLFDDDLRQLGDWAGRRLSCAEFRRM